MYTTAFFTALIPSPYGLKPPVSFLALLLFLISMLLGFLVVVAFAMLIYLSVFYTLNSWGTKLFIASIMEFFSGAVIPLPFFPERLRQIVELLPFASMQSTPFYIYSGYISGTEAGYRILLQAFWLSVLVAIGLFLEQRMLRHLVIQGG